MEIQKSRAGRLEVVTIRVSSPICETEHIISGKFERDMIIVTIKTPCEKFRKNSCLKFTLEAIPENLDKLILSMEKQINCSLECTKECALDYTRKCLIPPAVFRVFNVEKKLPKKEFVAIKKPIKEFMEFSLFKVPECTECTLQESQ